MKNCKIDKCLSVHKARGYCERHYYLVRKNGVPIPQVIRNDDEKRFWSYVEITNDCWLWKGSICKGYGQYRKGNKILRAHRYSYELLVGKPNHKLVIDHLCKVKNCVNPDHMEEVTAKENTSRHYIGV